MSEERKDQTKSHRKALKVAKWSFILSAGIVLLIFFGVPLYLSSAGGTRMLLGKINQSVDGQVQMDDFSIGWLKGVKLTNLSYADSAGNTSVTVARVETQPKYMSLLGGKVKLGRTVVEQPRIHLKVPAEQDAAEEVKSPSEKSDAPPPTFPVNQIDLELIDGAATVELTGDTLQKVSFTNIASKVQIAEAGKPSSVDISMDVNETSKISAKGSVIPDEQGWMLKKGDFEVHISELELASLKPLLALAGKEMDMSGQLKADADIHIDEGVIQRLKADARISNFAQGTGDQRTVFEKPVTISALTSADNDVTKIEKLTVQSDFCAVDCTGTMESLDYEIDADLEQTQRFAGQFVDMQGVQVAGDLAAKGTVNLAQESIGVTGTGTAKRFVVKKDGSPTPATDVQLDYDCAVDITTGQFRLASANLTAAPGTVNLGNMTLPLSEDGVKTISFDAYAKLDIEKALPFAQVFTDLPEDTQIAGILESEIKATTTGSKVRLLTDKTWIHQLRIQKGDGRPFEREQLSLKADATYEAKAELETVNIKTLALRDEKNAPLLIGTNVLYERKRGPNNTEVQGSMEVQYDLETVSAFASGYLPEGLSVKGKRKDTLRFDSIYPTDMPDKMIANLNADAAVGFDSAEYLGLNFGPTELNMDIQKGKLNFEIPQTVVNEGKLQFAGTIDLNEESKILRLKETMPILDNIHVNGRMTNTMLKYLSPIFAGQSDISGFASLTCKTLEIPLDADEKERILVDGVVEMDKVRLKAVGAVGDILAQTNNRSEFDAKLLPSQFLLKDGVMRYDKMEFHLDKYPTGFAGKIYLDKTLDMKVFVPYKFDVDRLRFPTVKIGEDLSERLSLPVDGTVDEPQVRLDKLFDSILKKHSPELIQKGIEELLKNL